MVIQGRKKIVFSANGVGTTGHPQAKKKKKKNSDTELTPFAKVARI